MNNILVGLLIGVSLIYRGEAVYNILGTGISVPLIKWDATSIADILDDSSEIWETCLDNNVKRSDMVVKQAALKDCNKHLYNIQDKSDSDDSLTSLKQACNGFANFKKCYHKTLKQVKNTCHLIGEDKEYTENAENIHTKISEMLCENDAQRLKDSAEHTMECTNSNKEKLRECANKYTVKDMEYDTDDCRKAWGFVDCVKDVLEECKEGASDVPVEVMSAGLRETKCNDEDPSGGSSLSPLYFLWLLAGLFAMNMA